MRVTEFREMPVLLIGAELLIDLPVLRRDALLGSSQGRVPISALCGDKRSAFSLLRG